MNAAPIVTLYPADERTTTRRTPPACPWDGQRATVREVWPAQGSTHLCDDHAALRADAHRAAGRIVEDRR